MDTRIAQTSVLPKDWDEDTANERSRNSLRGDESQSFIRGLFPMSAVLKKPDKVTGLEPGQVIRFARTSFAPRLFTIQTWLAPTSARAYPLRVSFNSQEVELIPPVD